MPKYDVYYRPNNLFYRVRLDAPLQEHAECSAGGRWIRSEYTLGKLLSRDNNVLLARNVVFKGRLC